MLLPPNHLPGSINFIQPGQDTLSVCTLLILSVHVLEGVKVVVFVCVCDLLPQNCYSATKRAKLFSLELMTL